MRSRRSRRAGVRAIVTLAVAVGFCALLLLERPAAHPQDRSSPAQEPQSEVRALWVLRTSLTSRASIAEMVRSAAESGFNTLLVQVRGRGDAFYTSDIEPRGADLQREGPSFDPLTAVLEAARPAGLRVHAWINVNLVSSAVDLPIARNHIVVRYPSWLMVPRDLAAELARAGAESPAYVGRLARWTRAQPEGIEGLYASPILPAAAAHAELVVRDIVRRYPIDGIHLDYARYPSARFDYSAGALAEFRAAIRPELTPAVRQDLDARQRTDLLAYADALPAEWKAFRVARMTSLVHRIRGAVKSVRPAAILTVAAKPDVQEALDHRLQNWPAWVQGGLVDAVVPMAYTPEPARFAEQIAAARNVAGSKEVWAGIGAYRLTAAQTVENIHTARRLGTVGIVLFSYDSLIDPRQAAADYLTTVGRAAFARTTSVAATR